MVDRDEREQLLVAMERLTWEEKKKKLMEGKGVWYGMKRPVGGAKVGIEMAIH